MRIGEALKRMGADVTSLERSRYSRRQREAEKMEAMLREIPEISPQQAAHIALGYLARVSKPEATEPFIMITPSQNAAVVDWIDANSKRRNEAHRLWARLYTVVHPTSGEIMLTREELAERLNILPLHVSRIMSELASIGAIQREKRGRTVRYLMSQHIATHQPLGPKLDQTRAATPKLRLVGDVVGEAAARLEAQGQMRLID
jgi:hypothetical protein